MTAHSELVELRPTVASNARRSFIFLALHVLGLRIAEARCHELQAGAVPLTAAEMKAAAVWDSLSAGRPPEGLAPHEQFLLA